MYACSYIIAVLRVISKAEAMTCFLATDAPIRLICQPKNTLVSCPCMSSHVACLSIDAYRQVLFCVRQTRTWASRTRPLVAPCPSFSSISSWHSISDLRRSGRHSISDLIGKSADTAYLTCISAYHSISGGVVETWLKNPPTTSPTTLPKSSLGIAKPSPCIYPRRISARSFAFGRRLL